MNPYDYEFEVQRRRDATNALGRQAYELLQQDAAVAQQRLERRKGLGLALAALFQRLRRPRQRPAAQPARGRLKGA